MNENTRKLWLGILNVYHLLVALYAVLRLFAGGRSAWISLLDAFALYWFLPLLFTVPMTVLLRSIRSSVVSGVLLTLGLVWFAPPLGNAPGISSETLRVITYNTYGLNEQLDDDVRWLLTQEADIIVLQEIVSENYDERLLPLNARYPYRHHIAGSIRIFSRYPFLDSDVITVEPANGEFAERLALRSVVLVDGQAIVVYSVHFSLPMRGDAKLPTHKTLPLLSMLSHYDETHRNSQIANIAERVARDTNPVLVLGDFNTSHTSTVLRDLRRVGLRDAYQDVGSGYGFTFPAWSGVPPLLRIDYVWHSRELRPVQAMRGMRLGSDHYPLVVDFEMR